MPNASQKRTEKRADEDLKAMVKIASNLAGPAPVEEKAYQVMKELLVAVVRRAQWGPVSTLVFHLSQPTFALS